MKACLIQCASGPYRQLQMEAAPWHMAYCDRHQIDYTLHLGTVQSALHPIWDRLPLIQNAFTWGYQLVIWLDSDSLVVNPAIDLRHAAKEFAHIGMCIHPEPWETQPWHFNAGVIFLQNTPATLNFLARVATLGQVDHPWWKIQATMLHVNQTLPAIARISNRWNSTEGLNDHVSPVIESWHGHGHELAATKLRAKLDLVKKWVTYAN